MKFRFPRPGEVLRIGASLVRLAIHRTLVEVPFHGATIVADLNTSHGLGMYRRRSYVDPDLSLVARYLTPGDVFVDCGANNGMFTVVGASRVRREGLVISFEPVPDTRTALQRNVSANGFDHVIVLPHALSDTRSERMFFATANGGGLSSFVPAVLGTPMMVEALCLDDVLPLVGSRSVSFLKMDVEGAEVAALRGAQRLLREHQPMLLVEVEDEHLRRQDTSAAELFALLESLGYRPATGGQPPNVLFTPQRPGMSTRQD
jgi:FkbM family methyltransferase